MIVKLQHILIIMKEPNFLLIFVLCPNFFWSHFYDTLLNWLGRLDHKPTSKN